MELVQNSKILVRCVEGVTTNPLFDTFHTFSVQCSHITAMRLHSGPNSRIVYDHVFLMAKPLSPGPPVQLRKCLPVPSEGKPQNHELCQNPKPSIVRCPNFRMQGHELLRERSLCRRPLKCESVEAKTRTEGKLLRRDRARARSS